MRKIVLALACAGMLAGCASQADQDVQDYFTAMDACTAQGFKSATSALTDCIERMRDRQDQRRRMNAAMALGLMQAQQAQRPYQAPMPPMLPAAPPMVTTNCTRFGNMVNCQSF